MATYFYGTARDYPRGWHIVPDSPIGEGQYLDAYSTISDATEQAIDAALARWDKEGRDKPYQPSWARVYEVEFIQEPEVLADGLVRSPFPAAVRQLVWAGTGDPIPDS